MNSPDRGIYEKERGGGKKQAAQGRALRVGHSIINTRLLSVIEPGMGKVEGTGGGGLE